MHCPGGTVDAGAMDTKPIATFAAGLVATLDMEDRAEERGTLSPHDRITCGLHRRWVHECVSSPQHAIAVTGHRWCRGCGRPVAVAVDELAGTVALLCGTCGAVPDSLANRQVVRACRASLAASRRAVFRTRSVA